MKEYKQQKVGAWNLNKHQNIILKVVYGLNINVYKILTDHRGHSI